MKFNWRKVVGLQAQDATSTALGPDFPGSAGDRERGKFRPSDWPRLTTVAVSDDGGQPVGTGSDRLLEELIREVRLLRHALVLQGLAADMDESIS